MFSMIVRGLDDEFIFEAISGMFVFMHKAEASVGVLHLQRGRLT